MPRVRGGKLLSYKPTILNHVADRLIVYLAQRESPFLTLDA